MTQRPSAVLALLLVSAAGAGGTLLAWALLVASRDGVAELLATVLGALTACVLFLVDPERVPLSAIVIAGLTLASAVGLARVIRSYRRAARLLRGLPLEPVEEGPLASCARRAGVSLLLLTSSRPAAFCAGLRRPHVVVSTGLLERLDPEEQEAVVWHEAAHVRNREPLRSLVARLAADTFVWLPALRALLERYLLTKELTADREAIARTSRRALAGALSQAIAQSTPYGAVGLAGSAAVRIDRVFEPRAPLPPLVGRGHLLLSLVVVIALAAAFLLPASLGPADGEQMLTMSTTLSLHGLPGMLAGLALNLGTLLGVAAILRRAAS